MTFSKFCSWKPWMVRNRQPFPNFRIFFEETQVIVKLVVKCSEPLCIWSLRPNILPRPPTATFLRYLLSCWLRGEMWKGRGGCQRNGGNSFSESMRPHFALFLPNISSRPLPTEYKMSFLLRIFPLNAWIQYETASGALLLKVGIFKPILLDLLVYLVIICLTTQGGNRICTAHCGISQQPGQHLTLKYSFYKLSWAAMYGAIYWHPSDIIA